jgi:hypothetical protein
LSRRTTVVKQIRASGVDFLLIDGGNALFGGLSGKLESDLIAHQYVEKAKVIIASYNAMGYHAMGVGDGEIGIGLERIKALEKLMKFPLLCANLVDAKTDKPIFTPSTIVTVGSIKVGLFGTIMNTLNPRHLERVLPGVKLIDNVEAGKKCAAELRPQVDFVIGLCHANDDENRKLLAASPDIDIVLDPSCFSGNHTMWVSEDKYLTWVDGKAMLRCDGQGSRLGRFDIAIGERRKPFVPWAAFQEASEKQEKGGTLSDDEKQVLLNGRTQHLGGIDVIPIFPHFAEAPEIKAMVDQFRSSTRFAEVKAEEEQKKAKERYLTVESCRKCHEENYRKWRETMHGKAYATLAKTGDEFRYDCLPCHTLGYGETFIDAHQVGPYKDVQCENCHGTNPLHADDPKKHTWKKIEAGNCLVCHNPEHLGEPFDFPTKVHKETCCTVGESVAPPAAGPAAGK